MPLRQLHAAASQNRIPQRTHAWLPVGSWIGFGVAIAAVLAIAYTSVAALQARQEAADRLTQTNLGLSRLQALLTALQDSETGQRGFLLTDQPQYLEPFMLSKATVQQRLQELRASMADDAEQTVRVAETARLVDVKFGEMQNTIDLQRAGKTDEALALVRSNAGKITMDQLRAQIAEMARQQEVQRRIRQDVWQEAADGSMRIALLGSALLLVLMIAAAVLTARAFRANQDESWVRAVQAAFARELQGEQRLDVLAERVMGFLSRLLSAPAGALYVAQPDHSLRRWGGYALTPGGAPEVVAPGEGLVGEAARAVAPLRFSPVPAEHLPVASGVGRSAANELLLMPARHDDELQAVIELALLRPADEATLAMLERVSVALSVAVRASRDRTRLEELLEETQRQSEELQSQQEELRVSNEELESQGTVLRESQAALEIQQTELERSNAQLAQHAGTLEHQQRVLLHAQTELQQQSEALSSASRYKSEFLANMSHELRTPLNSALILSRLLVDNKNGNLSDEQVRFAQAIHDANNDLLVLINDVLDLSKIEAGHVDLQRETLRITDIVERLRTIFEPMARQKGLKLLLTIAADAPQTFVSDGQRVLQVLKNLLSNAVKFTAAGEVELTVGAAAQGGVRFDVRDTGMGIAADKQQLIFEAFRQADGSTSRQFGGTGLGLSISRELVLRLGGELTLQSAPGAGSTFRVNLPASLPEAEMESDEGRASWQRAPQVPSSLPSTAATAPAGPAAIAGGHDPSSVVRAKRSEPAEPGSGRRMLLAVEDDSRFAEVLKRLVEEQGFDCTVVGTGKEALALAAESAPSGILLDIGLPDQSGLAVLERLKRDPRTRHIPVHLVSSYERSRAALEMGAIGHLVKPARREELIDAIRLLEQKLDQPLRRVLVVEDDAALRQNLQMLLAGPQVEIVTVGSVADALHALATTTFDCMVTDLALPDGSGFDLLERMSESDTLGFPPVIVYTGRALSRDEEIRLRRHSRSIIVKGARSPERLLDEVTLFLHSVEAQLPSEQRRLLDVARTRDGVLDGRCILLAEDDVRNIFALASVFEPQGVKLEIARNGREALQKVQSLDNIDLVLMDVMMPEMDGLEAMRRIRALPGLDDLPIIALTAKAMADDRQQCLAAGANDYLAKPIDVDRLLSLCRVWMPK